ncbi:MAG: hypothetical protein ACOC80_10660, partial [Petrotogales bacterium]
WRYEQTYTGKLSESRGEAAWEAAWEAAMEAAITADGETAGNAELEKQNTKLEQLVFQKIRNKKRGRP